MPPRISYFSILLLTSIFALGRIEAQTNTGLGDLPEGITLPTPGISGTGGVRINSENASQYKAIILPELFKAVQSGELQFEAVGQLNFEWRLNEEWYKAAAYRPVQNGTSINLNQLGANYPFPEVFDSVDAQPDHGAKILWNINANFWGQRILKYNFGLFNFKDGRMVRELRGILTRFYPALLGATEGAGQIFRESLQLERPQILEKLAWLTFRFVGPDEDYVWAFSPAIQKTRQLTGSNRADSFARSSIAPDDFLGWSGKPELLDAKIGKKVIALTPFIEPNLASLTGTERQCIGLTSQSLTANRSSGFWNYETKYFSNGAPWLPVKAVFVPRALWRIELSSKDPYSLYGRQVLYVDAESMLPAYKIVFDRTGNHWKTVIVGNGLGISKEKTRKVPFNAFLIVNDHISKETSAAETRAFDVCDAQSEQLKISDLDPSRLQPPAAAPAVK